MPRNQLFRIAPAALTMAGLLFVLAPGAAAQQHDLTGTWIFDVNVDGSVTQPIIRLVQDGEELTGHYSSATLGEAELEGSVEGTEFSFSFQASVEVLGPASVTYTGTIEDAETLQGNMDLGGMIQGTFTARPHEEDEEP